MAISASSIRLPDRYFNDPEFRDYHQKVLDSIYNLEVLFAGSLQTVSASRTLVETDSLLWVDTTCTLTVPKGLSNNGKPVVVYVDAGATLTLGEASGVVLNWFQGNSNSTGNRTVAQYSRVELRQETPTNYALTGIGIS